MVRQAQTRGLPGKVESLFPKAVQEDLLALRRDLHRHPELAFHEDRTAEILQTALQAIHPLWVKRVAGTGVAARIRGRRSDAPVVAIRGDIDALPVQEETGLDFASIVPGVMHACGHDIHAAWTVGAAWLLAHNPPAGDVMIVLQPAEEKGTGAKAVLKSGVLSDVSAIFAGHVDQRFLTGQIVAQAGPVSASADAFHICLRGRGGHGARPHEAVDPVVGLGALIPALQTVVSRRIQPDKPAVLSVGSVSAGNAPNVIPDTATMTGTIRALDPAVRKQIHKALRHITEKTAAAHGLKAEVDIEDGTPSVINSVRATDWARSAGVSLLGERSVVQAGLHNLGGEDFSFYLKRMEGCFLRIGARKPGRKGMPAHTSRYAPDENALFVGAAVLAESVRRASETLASD